MFWKKKPAPAHVQAQTSQELPEQLASADQESDAVVDSGFIDETEHASAVPHKEAARAKPSRHAAPPRPKALQSSVQDKVKRIKAVSPVGYIAGILKPTDPAPGLAYAGLWRRYVAFLIDFPLSLLAAIAVEMLAKAVLPKSMQMQGLTPIALMFIAQFAYFVLFEGSNWKATPGKRFLKLRVTDKRGQKISKLRATVRLLVGLPFMALIAGFFMIAFNRKRQSIADRVTSTLVVRKTSESFLPKAARPFEFPVILVMAAVLTYGALTTTAKIIYPVMDRITLQLMTEASLELMVPAQKSVEAWVAKNKSLPAQLDSQLIGYSKRGTPHTIAYNPGSGAITLWFMSTPMQGQGLSLIPTLEKGGDKIVWRCAGVNMDAESTPALCAPSRR